VGAVTIFNRREALRNPLRVSSKFDSSTSILTPSFTSSRVSISINRSHIRRVRCTSYDTPSSLFTRLCVCIVCAQNVSTSLSITMASTRNKQVVRTPYQPIFPHLLGVTTQSIIPIPTNELSKRTQPPLAEQTLTPVSSVGGLGDRSRSSASRPARVISASADDDDHLMDRWCFYCDKQFRRIHEKFVICQTCHAFTACRECWATKGNRIGYNKATLESRQRDLLHADATRTRPRWPRLEYHKFTMEHANSKRSRGELEFAIADSTAWDDSESDSEGSTSELDDHSTPDESSSEHSDACD
jgi:hypothetical protein